MQIWENIVDFIFPKKCFVCENRLFESNVLCKKCEDKLEILEKNICDKCGSIKKKQFCDVCNSSNFLFDKSRSVFKYNKIMRNLIHQFKYKEMVSVADYFSGYLAKKLDEFSEPDVVLIPVPLHPVKMRIRGFNQASLLAKNIAKKNNLKSVDNLIIRKRFTKSQTKLGREDRIKNLQNAFVINDKYFIKDKNFVIIDDVFTTGTTANEIAKLIKTNGGNKVFVLTIARAEH